MIVQPCSTRKYFPSEIPMKSYQRLSQVTMNPLIGSLDLARGNGVGRVEQWLDVDPENFDILRTGKSIYIYT